MARIVAACATTHSPGLGGWIEHEDEPKRNSVLQGLEVLRDKLLAARPDLIIADVCLPDGSAVSIFEAARDLVPAPIKIGISGQASAEQAFELARLGVHGYLAKPFTLEDVARVLRRWVGRRRVSPPEALAGG